MEHKHHKQCYQPGIRSVSKTWWYLPQEQNLGCLWIFFAKYFLFIHRYSFIIHSRCIGITWKYFCMPFTILKFSTFEREENRAYFAKPGKIFCNISSLPGLQGVSSDKRFSFSCTVFLWRILYPVLSVLKKISFVLVFFFTP